MRRANRWIVAALFIGSLAVLAPAGAQGIYAVDPLEGPPGTQVTVTGHLLDCYGGPGEITPYFGFPDRVAYYWNPQAMSSDEGGLLYETYDSNPNDKSGLVELASYEFGESGWTLTFSVPGDAAPGNHYNVVAFEPRCQRFVRNTDGTDVEEDRNADNYVTNFCVTDASGTCPTVSSSGNTSGAEPESGTGVASSTETGGSDGGIDPTVAILAGVILTALGGAGTVSSIRKPRGPTKPARDRYEPRDTNECGAELAHLDAQLNRALTSLRNLADGRSKVRMEKLNFEITAQDCRIKAAEIRSAVARAEGEAAVAVFTGVLGGTFWAMTGTALVASSSLVGVIAGWGLYGSGMGIRIWRATEMLKLGDTLYNGIKVDGVPGFEGRVPLWKLPAIRVWAKQASAAADFAAQLPDLFANQYNKDLEARRIAIEAARAEADGLWQERERTFQNCASAGHLPPGTWHRPEPAYSFDSEGVIIGVGY